MRKAYLILLFSLIAQCILATTSPKVNYPCNGYSFIIFGHDYSNVPLAHHAAMTGNINWGAWSNTPQEFYSFQNTLELNQFESTDLPVGFDYELKISGTLEYCKFGNPVPVFEQVTLSINNKNLDGDSKVINLYHYRDAYKSKFTIESLKLTTTSTNISEQQLFTDVAKVVELNFGIQKTHFIEPVFNNPIYLNSCLDNNSNELVLWWAPVDYAEEYELEILYVDDYAENGSVLLPSVIQYNFRENAIRLIVTQFYYRMPLVYDRGYLLYRVRPVGMGGADWDKRIPCAWSNNTPEGFVNTFGDKYYISNTDAHSNNKINWQLNTTFAEDGKRKDVAEYYDGLYMSRQTVTGVSERKEVITNPNLPTPITCQSIGGDKIKNILAQEIIYDFNGRPAVQILPVPTGTHIIQYIPKLNQNVTAQSYSWSDFDQIDNCRLLAQPLKTTTTGGALGAGVYYSPNNPDKVGFNAFIPDGKGYPFSRVQYLDDNTGRVFRQGGVGEEFQLDTEHETSYFYAKPNQFELCRMFGTEVGFDKRYLKKMVVDPNRQTSVSYENAKGQVIATALAGIKPDNLLALDNEPVQPVQIEVVLDSNNVTDDFSHSFTINEHFLVAEAGDYTFNYSVDGQALKYLTCNNKDVCLDCIYDLDISLISNDFCSSTPVFSYTGTFGDIAEATKQPRIDLNCLNKENPDAGYVYKPSGLPGTFVKTLPAGSYTIAKKLTVNKNAAEAYVDLVFSDTCQSVFNEMLEHELSLVDTTDCYQNCDSCLTAFTNHPDSCDLVCPPVLNECEHAREMMLKDFKPGGQYAQFDVTTTGYSAVNYPLSIFNQTNQLSLSNPIDYSAYPFDEYLTLDSLIANWETAYSVALLTYHPENCMLQWCEGESPSYDFDLTMRNSDTYYDANVNQIFDSTSTIVVYEQILDNDPFFSGTAASKKNNFLIFLNNICGKGKNILQMARFAAYCQSQPGMHQLMNDIVTNPVGSYDALNTNPPDCVPPVNYLLPNNEFSSDRATRDLEWRILCDLYLSYKEKYLYENRLQNAIDNHCINDCIGAESFVYFGGTIDDAWINYQYFIHNITINTNDICGTLHVNYKNKVKHFTSRYDAFNYKTTGYLVNLTGIDLYDPCMSDANITNIQSQLGGITSQYLCPPDSSTIYCLMEDFIGFMNLYLPQVTATNWVTISGNQIPDSIRNTSSGQIDHIVLKYTNGKYQILFYTAGNVSFCDIQFPAVLSNNTPKQIASLSYPNYINQYHFSFKMQFTDGTATTIIAETKCPWFDPCPPSISYEIDTCMYLSPFAKELFSFLDFPKKLKFYAGGLYHPANNKSELYRIYQSEMPIHFSFNPQNCVLTFSGIPVIPDHRQSYRRDSTCTITFSDCTWLTGNADLISITPFFPTGHASALTNQFILSFHLPNDTLIRQVKGVSNCLPINICHTPYLCNQDTITWLPPDTINNCVRSQYLIAEYNAHFNYNHWLDSMKNDLLERYYAKCMKVTEQLSYVYTDRQFHYTLYYYDQTGNLLSTVPPAGVRLLEPQQTTDAIESLNHNRLPVVPHHAFVTHYKYNSLNQLIWQSTPDAGESNFFYDKLGRIAASQNARQKPLKAYSYTWYDKLGRIVESGELHLNAQLHQTTVSNYNNWKTFLYQHTRTEITFTQYDKPFSPTISGKFGLYGQQNLRSRVAGVFSFENNVKQLYKNYRYATHYNYDVRGNVPVLIQDYPNTPLGDKVIAYDYDLVSGKVNELRYQPGKQDEFRHRYIYDDNLRITEVHTSRKGIIWQQDAGYFYYKHGLLARAEIGQLKVQGLDYIYTLQGWIKAVNGTAGSPEEDAGHDGIALQNPVPVTTIINGQPVLVNVESNPNLNLAGPGYNTLHNPVASDAFGYVLSYYNDDYKPIVSALNTTQWMDNRTGDVQPLYNGNISGMYTQLFSLGGMGMNYRYDQLNRLKQQQGFAFDKLGIARLLPNDAYGMKLSYDGNGNIITLGRNGTETNPEMDNLLYYYYDAAGNTYSNNTTPPVNATNRLSFIKETIPATNYPEANNPGTVTDIDAQDANNYKYDAIGNLISDAIEGIDKIGWNLQNKVQYIDKANDETLTFEYDALGNRVYKMYKPGNTAPHDPPFPFKTYYVRDAQGNILATYEVKQDGNFYWQEQVIYGSNRLGIWQPKETIVLNSTPWDGTVDWQNIHNTVFNDSLKRGSKQYELTNHLGNVLATITDRKLPATTGAPMTYIADLASAQDYYAFGMEMPGRNSNSEIYRFGMNGQEKDNEIYGNGNAYTAEFWEYDPRIGRRWNLEPMVQSFESPYTVFNNNPIIKADPKGNTAEDKFARQEKRYNRLKNRLERKFGEGTIKYNYELLKRGSRKRYGSFVQREGNLMDNLGKKMALTAWTYQSPINNIKSEFTEVKTFTSFLANPGRDDRGTEGALAGIEENIEIENVKDGEIIYLESNIMAGYQTQILVDGKVVGTFDGPTQVLPKAGRIYGGEDSRDCAKHPRGKELMSLTLYTGSNKPALVTITFRTVFTKEGAIVHHKGYPAPAVISKIGVARFLKVMSSKMVGDN